MSFLRGELQAHGLTLWSDYVFWKCKNGKVCIDLEGREVD